MGKAADIYPYSVSRHRVISRQEGLDVICINGAK